MVLKYNCTIHFRTSQFSYLQIHAISILSQQNIFTVKSSSTCAIVRVWEVRGATLSWESIQMRSTLPIWPKTYMHRCYWTYHTKTRFPLTLHFRFGFHPSPYDLYSTVTFSSSTSMSVDQNISNSYYLLDDSSYIPKYFCRKYKKC